MPKSAKFTPPTAAAYEEAERMLIARGHTIGQIAHAAGMSWWQVYKFARRRGITIRGQWMTDDERRAAIRMVEIEDLTIKGAAECLGVSEAQVWRLIQTRREEQLRRATEDFATKRTKRAKTCPRHGPVHFWPCVACAAEARQTKRTTPKGT
jgi:hypothetical protein